MSGILLAHRHAGAKTEIALPAIGDAWLGGYYAGVMDSRQSGAIPVNDASQTGARYALIDLGLAAENASVKYKTSNSGAPAACSTVWDGLAATQAMIAAGSAYPAAQYAAGYSVPSDSASQAYIPAMWELLAMYWYFKPFTNGNYLSAGSGSSFPGGTVTQGLDPASDPQRPAFTSSVPGQTPLLAWRTGGAQAFQASYYWTATEYSTTTAWMLAWLTSIPGGLTSANKSDGWRLRLVRRLYL